MTDPSKKDVERWQLDRFREAIDDFPAGDIISGEEPDFVVKSKGSIGIELTSLIRRTPDGRQPMQEAESLRSRICKLAQKRFEASGGNSHQVYVEFAPHARLTKRRVPLLSDEELLSISV